MTRRIIDFELPERFATGTISEDGERTFFLQAVQGREVTTVRLEREQVAVLADRVLAIIDEVERRGLTAIDAGPAGELDERPLEQPLDEEFHVGTMIIAWDDDVDQVVVEARSMTFDAGAGDVAVRDEEDVDGDEIPDDAPIGPDVLRVHLTPHMAQQFARRANSVVAGGRPTCPYCGAVLEPSGHFCTRGFDDLVH
ncbi:MAG: DUF3090 family protein [Candidatus Limnocylindrales bacterium]